MSQWDIGIILPADYPGGHVSLHFAQALPSTVIDSEGLFGCLTLSNALTGRSEDRCGDEITDRARNPFPMMNGVFLAGQPSQVEVDHHQDQGESGLAACSA